MNQVNSENIITFRKINHTSLFEKRKMVNLIDIALDSVALVKNESVGKLF